MKCPDIETIQKHIDNELSCKENEAFLRHIEECQHCQNIKISYENELKEIKHLIDQSKPPEINIPLFKHKLSINRKIKVVRLFKSTIIVAASIAIFILVFDHLISVDSKVIEPLHTDNFTINYNLNQYLTYDYIVSVEPKNNQ